MVDRVGGNNNKNLIQFSRQLTPEERKASSQRAAAAHSANAARRREEARIIAMASTSLAEAAEQILRTGDRDRTRAYQVVERIADIAIHGSEANATKAAKLLGDWTGVNGPEDVTLINVDLSTLSTAELRKRAIQLQEQTIVDADT